VEAAKCCPPEAIDAGAARDSGSAIFTKFFSAARACNFFYGIVFYVQRRERGCFAARQSYVIG